MIRVISLKNTEPLLVAAKRPVIIYVEVGGGKKEGKGGGGQGYFRLARGGG